MKDDKEKHGSAHRDHPRPGKERPVTDGNRNSKEGEVEKDDVPKTPRPDTLKPHAQ